jgi:hypothetical protein
LPKGFRGWGILIRWKQARAESSRLKAERWQVEGRR